MPDNLDPEKYFNGAPDTRPAAVPIESVAVAAGEIVNSASPAITLGPAKAVAAFVATMAVAFLGALGTALSDNVVTGNEWVTIALATIVGSGLVGGATFAVRTTVKGNS